MRLFELAALPEPARPAPPEEPALALFAQMLEMPQANEAPKMAQVDWAALATPPPAPQPPLAETGLFARPREASVLPPLAPSPLPAPAPASAPAAADDFAIFASLGGPRDAMQPAPPAPAGSTLSRLKHVVTHPGQAGLPHPVSMASLPDPQRGLGGGFGTSMPAAAVTVPLGEVMRLVAAGGPPAASPFDTFRAALRTPSPF